jgi:hypothetical protein
MGLGTKRPMLGDPRPQLAELRGGGWISFSVVSAIDHGRLR